MSSKEEYEIQVGICNSLNAISGRFKYSDPWLSDFLLRTQQCINDLIDEIKSLERLKDENKN